MISVEPALTAGNRTYTIVFSSNAPVTPALFDGTDPGAPTNTDMNTEIWTYQFTVPEVADLSQGADIAFQDLSTGTFTRITNTPASRAPSAGSLTGCFANAGCQPFYADDNREAQISDAGDVIAFVSTRDIVSGGNVDTGQIPNPEIFLFNRGTGLFTQATNTITTNILFPVFNGNPNLAGSGGSFTLAFASSANLTANNDDGGGTGNGEVYVATYNGAAIVAGSVRQVTKTKNNTTTQQSAVVFTTGRRLSRDGRWIAMESLAENPTANATTNTDFLSTFVCDLLINPSTCAPVGPRALTAPGDVNHFPGFTDYTGTSPGTVVFTSALNFKSDGTFPTTEQDNTGLNPGRVSQIFATSLPAATTGPFTRLSNITGTTTLAPVNSLLTNSRRRIAFTMGGAELGGGNLDNSGEVFYQLIPAATTDSTATISIFTGASLAPVASPSPTASPSGSPSPSPSPSPTGSPATGPLVAPGLAAGELARITSSASLAPSAGATLNASETFFAPALPVELRGVSVSIRGAAAGLYSVSSSAISFVVPKGLPVGVYPIVINNNGTVIRGLLAIVAAQPDIETSTNGPNGRAVICNVTNPTVSGCLMEPFDLTSPNASGSPVPTVLELHLTGVRLTAANAINVLIGSTSIVPSSNIPSAQPGFDLVTFTLPSTLPAGDRGDNVPVVVRVGAATSRPTPGDTPPLVKINP